jgi:hypothetical protein
MKNLFHPLQHKKTASSPASSSYNLDATTSKYERDPVRTSKRRDTYGNFVDPMSVHGYNKQLRCHKYCNGIINVNYKYGNKI